MHLTPREIDKLTLHQAGFLAQKRLARGLRLNHPEAVATVGHEPADSHAQPSFYGVTAEVSIAP